MASMQRTIRGIAASANRILKKIAVFLGIRGQAAAGTRVIEFYVAHSFRSPRKWVAASERGKIIAFGPDAMKSA
jgi:hypothetical protein